MVVRVGEGGNRTDGDKNWEFEKRSKHFSFGDHFVNSYSFSSCFCTDIVFDIGHSWDLKGYTCIAWISSDYFESLLLPQQSDEFQANTCMIVRVSVAWITLLLTVTWQPVLREVCIFSCDLSSLHICCRITTNLFIKGIHDCLGKNMQQGLVTWLDC